MILKLIFHQFLQIIPLNKIKTIKKILIIKSIKMVKYHKNLSVNYFAKIILNKINKLTKKYNFNNKQKIYNSHIIVILLLKWKIKGKNKPLFIATSSETNSKKIINIKINHSIKSVNK